MRRQALALLGRYNDLMSDVPQGQALIDGIEKLRRELDAVILSLLPGRRDPGPGRFRRRQPRALSAGGEDLRESDRLLRRALHGRDGEDLESRKAGTVARS